MSLNGNNIQNQWFLITERFGPLTDFVRETATTRPPCSLINCSGCLAIRYYKRVNPDIFWKPKTLQQTATLVVVHRLITGNYETNGEGTVNAIENKIRAAVDALRKWILRYKALLGECTNCWASNVYWKNDLTEIDIGKTNTIILNNFAVTLYLRFPVAFCSRDVATVYLWMAMTEEEKCFWRNRLDLLIAISSYMND